MYGDDISSGGRGGAQGNSQQVHHNTTKDPHGSSENAQVSADRYMEEGGVLNPIRTWPRVHPSRGQIRSCIEFSPTSVASVPISRNPDGNPIRSVYTTTSSSISSSRFVEDTPSSTTRASRCSSTHEPGGHSRRQSFSHIPPRPSPNTSHLDLSHFLGLTHLNLGLTLDFPEDDDDPHSGASSSAHSATMDHDSLEDLHRQQDAEFQELLADFADQQHELEQRKPSTSNTSLSLSSIVSNEDTSESSCGTLSEIFESLSRFSEHCLASVEALSSPMYLNSSSFTTTPTGPGDNFGFDFDYDGLRRDELLPIRREDYMEDRLRQRERDVMLQNEPRRRHSSVIEGRFDLLGGRRDDPLLVDHRQHQDPLSLGLNRSHPHNNHQTRARDEFFRSILETGEQRFNISDTGGGGGPSRSVSSGGQVQGNQSQPQEAVSVTNPGVVASRRASKNTSLDIGLELEIFSAGLEVVAGPSSSGSSVQPLLGGADGENSIVAALSILRESGPLVSALDWQERCVELELALQRFGEQAARVRVVLRDKLAELERRVVEAETRAEDAEDKVRVMEQQLSEATSNASAWAMGEEAEKLCTLQLAVREKDRVISRLECQVEEQRLLRLQESRQVEEKAAKIKEWVSNKLHDLEEQNEHLREQNQKCETQLELLRGRLTQLSTLDLNSLQSSKNKDRHSTEDSSRGSYEGDRPPSDESPPPPDSSDQQNGTSVVSSSQTPITRSISATAACIAAIKRRSGAFDTPEERERRRKSNLSTSSTSGGTGSSLRDPERRSRDSRGSRVDSGSVDMETPQSLSPRSPLDSLEALDVSRSAAPSAQQSNLPGTSGSNAFTNGAHSSTASHTAGPLVNGHRHHNLHAGTSNGPPHSSHASSSASSSGSSNKNHVIISSPSVHPVPPPVPVLTPQPVTISHSPSPATPVDVVMVGGSESTHSLISDRRVPIVPPRRCRTRSPTPNTSHGTTPGTCSPPTTEEEDASALRARLDAECQQLARDLQAAVRELVRPELSLVGAVGGTTGGLSGSGSSSNAGSTKVNGGGGPCRGKAMDEIHDYSEIYTPSGDNPENGLPLGLSQPPPPPMHRFPSWESRIYEVAAGGLKVPSNGDANGGPDVSSTNGRTSYNSLGINFSIPVYTTVKGRASQIRSAPFSGDSSDSSDGEELGSGSGSGPSHPMSSGETDISSPGKSAPSSIANSLSPLHRSSSSPSKSVRREPSFGESEVSDDYAIPPDAFASETSSLDIALSSGCRLTSGVTNHLHGPSGTPGPSTVPLGPPSSSNPSGPTIVNSVESSPRKESLEKAGYLTKLGGKLKTWRKRYFVLKNGTLTYWKSQQEASRRPTGREIVLDENCRIFRGEGAATFEIATGKKTYYLTADSTAAVDDWVRVLQNVVRRNATKLVLSMEDSKPTSQGWLTKVKNGHAKRCWCVLIGKMFLTFKSPSDSMASGQVNMRDARVEDVDHVSDSDNDDKDETGHGDVASDAFTIGIFPSHQSPIYLHLATKQEKDSWLYHLTIVSGKGPSAGTQFEQLVHKLMEVDGDPNCSLWKNPLLLHSKESITSALTSLSSEALQNEAIKLFKSCQLFMSVPLDSSGIDYHVVLAQNALQLCLDYSELQAELICALVKQTSRQMSYKNSAQVNRTLHKIKHSRHFLLNATQSLFLCDSSSHHGKLHTGQNHTTTQPTPSSPIPSSSTNGSSAQLLRGATASSNHHGTIPITATGNGSVVGKGSSASSSNTISAFGSSLRGASSSSRSSPSKSSSKSKSKGSSSSVPSSPLLSHSNNMHHRALTSEGKSSVRSFVFVQGWQLLSLAVSLFLPKNNKLLWYLKQHLSRNIDTKSECGKYAAYCQRSIERTLANGPRLFKPSRMEVLSILMKNPFHHSLPHSVPVHFLNGAYQVVGFDGSTTVEEFLLSLCHEIGCREPSLSGFALFEDDPFEKELEHFLKPEEKICDVISQWETALRERGSGKFETRRAVTLSFKSRIYRRAAVLQETDRERLLLCYQTNQFVVSGRFPLTRELAAELAALMAQIDGGDYKPDKGRGSGGSQMIVQILEKYYPIRYRDSLSQEEYKTLCEGLVEKWTFLKGKSTLDCVRIYLTCTRKWPFFGATLFNVTVRGTHIVEDGLNVWTAVYEDGIVILDSITLQHIAKYSYSSVQTFGGAVDDHFMIVVDDGGKKRRLLFGGMSKFKVLEITRLVADYINACCIMYGNNSHGLTRHNSLKSCRFQGSTTLPPPTPRMDRKHLGGGTQNSSPVPLQRCDSSHNYRTPQQRT